MRSGTGPSVTCTHSNSNPSWAPTPYMSVWSPTDEALLAGMSTGDPDAAAAFVRRFQRRVYGFVFGILGDAAAAEDVSQEAFVRAWRHASTYDPRRGRVSSWLLTIARNLALDRARVTGARPVDPEVLTSQLDRQRTSSVSDIPSQIAEHDRLRELLEDLPPQQRRALVLATYFGRTAKEIGELDGTPLGTVKTRIRDGLQTLRRRLEVEDESA
jgi:RNA polymerase sigma factor (sigma-70 family)